MCTLNLGDHDMVLLEVAFKPAQTTQKRRKIHLYNQADWTLFRSKIKSYLSNYTDKSVDQLWLDFTENLEQMTDKCIP